MPLQKAGVKITMKQRAPVTDNPRNTAWIDIAFLTVLLGVFFFFGLDNRPLFVPDEARYSEIAREMLALHDFITPHLNGVKYFEKPVLFYWLGALAFKIGGLHIGAIRAVNAILGTLGCLLTYIAARTLYGRAAGLISACIQATSLLYFLMLHVANLDLSLCFFLSLSLYSFLLSTLTGSEKIQRLLVGFAFAASGLAVLTKGLIGFAFPCLIIGTWIIILKEWHVLKKLYLPSSLLIFAVIVLPWHILVQIRNPEFFSFYVIHQQFLRYATLEAHRYQPIWFFIPVLFIGFLPWIVFLPQSLFSALPKTWRNRFTFKNELYLILWVALIFAFFSFSKSKLISYILPIIPPLSILTARYLTDGLSRYTSHYGIKIGFILLALIQLGLAITLCKLPSFYQLAQPEKAAHYAYLMAVILLTGSITLFFLQHYQHTQKALIAIFITTAAAMIIGVSAAPYLDSRTILPLAKTIQLLKQPNHYNNDDVIAYKKYYQDLPFYLKQRITLVGAPAELQFGMQHQDTAQWIIDENTFWQRWNGEHRIFVIADRDDLITLQQNHPHEIFHILNQTTHNVLFSNMP